LTHEVKKRMWIWIAVFLWSVIYIGLVIWSLSSDSSPSHTAAPPSETPMTEPEPDTTPESGSTTDPTPNPVTSSPLSRGYDIIWIGGQSNACGTGAGGDYAVADERVFEVDMQAAEFSIVPAEEPVSSCVSWGWEGRGFVIPLANALVPQLIGSRQILIVSSALSGTAIEDGYNLDDPNDPGLCVTASLTQMAPAMEAEPVDGDTGAFENRVIGMFWHQGETNVSSDTPIDQYYMLLRRLVYHLRTNMAGCSDTTPFVLGTFAPEWIQLVPFAQVYDRMMRQVQRLLPYSACCDLSAMSSNDGDSIHFSTEALRLVGPLYKQTLPYATNSTIQTDLTLSASLHTHIPLYQSDPLTVVNSVPGHTFFPTDLYRGRVYHSPGTSVVPYSFQSVWTTSQWTLSCWFQCETSVSGNQYLLGHVTERATPQLMWWVTYDTVIKLNLQIGDGLETGNVATTRFDNLWHLFTVTVQRTDVNEYTVIFYIDGQDYEVIYSNIDLPSSFAFPMAIGSHVGSSSMDGRLSDLRLYTSTLSKSDVMSLYLATHHYRDSITGL
jgi:hypothetical protein